MMNRSAKIRGYPGMTASRQRGGINTTVLTTIVVGGVVVAGAIAMNNRTPDAAGVADIQATEEYFVFYVALLPASRGRQGMWHGTR